MATPHGNMAERWMQKAAASIKRRGTKGSFKAWCKKRGFPSGCSPGCIAAGRKAGGAIAKKANLAKAFCSAGGGKGGSKKKRTGGKRKRR